MDDKLAKSIEGRLKWLFWLLVPGAFVYLIIAVGLLVLVFDEHFEPKPKAQGKIVVARFDLPVGTELTKANLSLAIVPEAEWPEHLVSPGHAFAVIGHTLVRPVSKGKPLDWYDTDIPIPTPSVASEQVRHEINPEPTDTPDQK
jgi:hypothetical protein